MTVIAMRPPKVDPAVWRPEVPLLVLERCDSANQICTWLAIRWLMAAFPHKRGFGTRDIAQRARSNQKYITRWSAELAEKGLLMIVEHEQIRNLNARPVYSIPLREIEQASSAMVLDVLLAWGVEAAPTPPPREQMPLLSDPNWDRKPDPNWVQKSEDNWDQRENGEKISDPNWVQKSEDNWDRTSDPNWDHLREGGRKGGNEIPSPSLEVPQPPDGEPPLTLHPRALWLALRRDWTDADFVRLDQYVAEHDAATESGFGTYWLGRAILAAAEADEHFASAPRALNLVKTILTRWRTEGSYGSDRRRRPSGGVKPTTPATEPIEPPVVDAGLFDLWQRVLARVAAELPDTVFSTWISPTTLLDIDGEHAVVGTPNVFVRDEVDVHFRELLASAITAELERTVNTVEVVIGG